MRTISSYSQRGAGLIVAVYNIVASTWKLISLHVAASVLQNRPGTLARSLTGRSDLPTGT